MRAWPLCIDTWAAAGGERPLQLTHVSVLCWALTTAAAEASTPFFATLAAKPPPLTRADGWHADAAVVERLLCCCAHAGQRHVRLLRAAEAWLDGGRRLQICSRETVCSLLWSCATLRFRPSAPPTSSESKRKCFDEVLDPFAVAAIHVDLAMLCELAAQS